MKRRNRLVDSVLLTALLAAAVLGGLAAARVGKSPTASAYGWGIAAVQLATSSVILLRRKWPTGVAVTIVVSALVQTLALFTAPDQVAETVLSVSAWIPFALSVAVENITERGVPRRWSARVWALIAVLAVVSMRPWEPSTAFLVNGVLHSAVAPLFALYLAARRRRIQLLRERADNAEREQWWRTEQARAEERARLATELHDLVAHRVTLMTLQAGALTMHAPDDTTRAAAEELRANGALALDELRELVGVLRRGGKPLETPLDEPPTPPLAELVHAAERAGQRVEFVEAGEFSGLSRVTGRTAYRVVREALTNARKHAHGAAVRVDAEYLPDRVRIVVHNGAGRRALGAISSGTGLAGLRERVESIGGTLEVGPDEDGGFRLETVMPSKVSS
ncbi:sensor histidine kinase [Paractinoplanes lichenicola]|uniref:sensor histidine kinase n=1 Tax=Paractinoplanes lichenicola TaxID=2802976 RepID=UPI001F352D29|nr:histidine kinase [Actinoplanes lichenicola]